MARRIRGAVERAQDAFRVSVKLGFGNARFLKVDLIKELIFEIAAQKLDWRYIGNRAQRDAHDDQLFDAFRVQLHKLPAVDGTPVVADQQYRRVRAVVRDQLLHKAGNAGDVVIINLR